jgi:two-component system OmpR family sensor kinase
VSFAVTDQGQGIPAEDLPHVFERFFRGRKTAASAGVGLGLYSARILVEAHGGLILVDSRPGAGTTFRVGLPATPPS